VAARELGGGGLAGACGGALTCADAHALLGGVLALIAPPPGARGAGAGSPPLRVVPEAAAVAPRAGSYVIKYAGGAVLEPPPAARGGGGAPPGHHGGGGAWGVGLRQQYTAVLGHPQGFVRLGGASLFAPALRKLGPRGLAKHLETLLDAMAPSLAPAAPTAPPPWTRARPARPSGAARARRRSKTASPRC
jgi:hypothetical protein